MALTKEWLHRITHWNTALWKIHYEPLGILDLTGFVTQKHLSVEQVSNQKFHRLPIGTDWGTKWQYGWFKTEITLPETARGRRIMLHMNPAAKSEEVGECLVWVNEKIIGSFGCARQEITLTKNGIPGESYSILAEAYAGHGPLIIGGGPIFYGQESVPEVRKPQVIVGESNYGIWHEQAYQLALDFTTLFELRNRLDPNSLRVSEIDRGLRDVTLQVDLELPKPELLEIIELGRERLRPLLECVNGSTAPMLYAFGHAHLDVAWLWPLVETERKIARTVINQLSLFDEYPDYRFLQSQPQLYIMLKNRYPELYGRLKQAVLAGNVVADGAMWVEADTNLISGESLIRQIMYAKQFFMQEFSINSEVLWLPDVFGYSGALPQILVSCGCIGFATHKITWTYHGGEQFPYNTFLWEGIDGTAIPAHIFTDYNSETRPGSLMDRWETRVQIDGIRSMLLSFGWGDGGGGPTRDHLEFLSRAKDLEGLPKVKHASPAQFFAELKEEGLPKERYVGELYYQAHRGTYTSQAKTKLGNRRAEFSLREAEFWATIARTLNDYDFAPDTLKSSWLKLLLNQFHDILPGSSICRVYKEAGIAFDEVISSAKDISLAATSNFITSDDSVTVFNSLSWDRNVRIDFPEGPELVTVPACGWTPINLGHRSNGGLANQGKDIKVTTKSLENEFVCAKLNNEGELISLVDKETGIEMMAGTGNRFCLYKDVPSNFDAWDIDSMTEKLFMNTDSPVELKVIRSDPCVGKIKLVRKIHHSTLSQIISLQKGSRRIDFETVVDWQESHKLLKVAFPVNIHSNEALHEIQYGYIKRPNHRSRPFDADRFEVCNHKWTALAEENRGVAVLNDSKYGINVIGNCMNLTLLKSALAPDPIADKGAQTFTYALYFWTGSFSDSGVIREAYELNSPVFIRPGSAEETSIFKLDNSNIILETVKPAEDGTSDIILRLYESKGSLTKCYLSTILPVNKASQTDMLERFQDNIYINKGKITLKFRPFEVKTIRLTIDK